MAKLRSSPTGRLRRGDIVEFKTARGYAYAQFINEHKMYGTVMRVLPGVFAKRLADFEALVNKEGGWCAFWYIKDALQHKEVKVVGRAEIPKQYQKLPVFKEADRSFATALVRGWSIWDGKTTSGRPVAELSEAEKKYPLVEVIFTDHVIKRINKRWKPEDECRPGAKSINTPLKKPRAVLARERAARQASAS
jgi:hypothetical protein